MLGWKESLNVTRFTEREETIGSVHGGGQLGT